MTTVGINLSWVRVLAVACSSPGILPSWLKESASHQCLTSWWWVSCWSIQAGWGSCCVPRVLCCVTWGRAGKGLSGVEPQDSPKMDFHSVPTGVIRQWPWQGRHVLVPAVTGAAWELLVQPWLVHFVPAQRFPALHQGPGLSGFQAQSLKCGKAWKIGQRVRQGIVIFLKMLRELQCVSNCDSGDVKILRSLCPVHQDYH